MSTSKKKKSPLVAEKRYSKTPSKQAPKSTRRKRKAAPKRKRRGIVGILLSPFIFVFRALWAFLWRMEAHQMEDLPKHPIMQKWWAHMADIMDTDADNAPIVVPLTSVFHMP